MASLLALAMLVGMPYAQPALGAPHWFAPDAATLDGWRVAERDEDAVVIEPATGQPTRRIAVLWSKPSSAYDRAMGQVLAAFAAADVSVRWDIRKLSSVCPNATDCAPALAAWVGERTDLVITLGSTAMVVAHRDLRAGRAPVITIASKDPRLMDLEPPFAAGTRVAYTSVDAPASIQLADMRALLPDLRAVVAVSIRSNTAARRTQVEPLRAALDGEGRFVDAVFEAGPDLGAHLTRDLARIVQGLRADGLDPDHAVVWVTGCTALFEHIGAMRAGAAPFLVLGVNLSLVDGSPDGLAMAVGASYEANGRLGARYALDVLGGADPGALPVGVLEPAEVALDFRAMAAMRRAVPFELFERAALIYDTRGRLVRREGRPVARTDR